MKRQLTLTAVLAAVALLAVLAAPSVSAASTELTNQTISPGEDTTALRIIGEHITNDTASVTVYELDNGTETQVGSGTLNTSTSSTDTYEYSSLNTSLDYRVVVIGDGADLVSVNEVQVVAAGGGSGTLGGIGIESKYIAVAVLLAALAGGAVIVSRRV